MRAITENSGRFTGEFVGSRRFAKQGVAAR